MSENVQKKSLRIIIIYTVVISIVAIILFTYLVSGIPSKKENIPLSGDLEKKIFIMTVSVMVVAGVIGGCLYNYRGIIKHTSENDYDENFTITYFLRPISGGISGLTVFFILLGGALALNVGTNTDPEGWITFSGRMPYIAFAILAGYASQEFMLKLKDIAGTLFEVKQNDKK